MADTDKPDEAKERLYLIKEIVSELESMNDEELQIVLNDVLAIMNEADDKDE